MPWAEKHSIEEGKKKQIDSRSFAHQGPNDMRPPSLIRHPSTLARPTRAAIGIRNGGNGSNAAAAKGEAAAAQPQTPHRPPPPSPSPPLPFFSDLGLDRCSAARKDAVLLAELSRREGAEAVVVRGGEALMMEKKTAPPERSDGGGGGESESGSGGGNGNGNEDPDAPASPDLFLARLPLAEARRLLDAAGSRDSPILLGVAAGAAGAGGEGGSPRAGAPLFAVALPRGREGDAAAARAVEEAAKAAAARGEAPSPSSPPSPSPFAFVPVRSEGPRMPPRAAAVAALAVALSAFHSTALFDPRSGLETRMASAGHARDAVEEKEGKAEEKDGRSGRKRRPNRSRPRVDPAVLVLAPCRDFVLLGRKASWPKRRYSLLAGFAELGETLEQSAERELAEEAGVFASSSPSSSDSSSSDSSSSDSSSSSPSRYLGSQPWPFPSSLMVAMRVDVDPVSHGEEEAEGGAAGPGGDEGGAERGLNEREVSAATWPSRRLPRALPLDGELEDVRWFPAEIVREACERPAASCGLRLPGRHALARSVLASWSRNDAAASSASAPSSDAAFFTSLFSSEAFPCVPRVLPESIAGGGEDLRGHFELFRVRRERTGGGGGGGGGEETALALRWRVVPSPPSSTTIEGGDDLTRAAEREASSSGLSVEALGGGEIAFGRRRRESGGKEKEKGEEEEAETGSGSVPLEERRIVLRSSSSISAAAAQLLLEVCACLVRRAHPLAEVAVE